MATPEASRFVSMFVEDGLRRSTRMRVLSVSRKIGRPEEAIRSIWHVYEKGWSEAGLVFFAPTIRDAAPKLFDQPSLFDDGLTESDTAFELLQDAITDVRRGSVESNRYDSDLLQDFSRMKHAVRGDVTSLTFPSVQRAEREPADKVLAERAQALLAETPGPRRLRVVGRLDMLRLSESVFELFVASTGEKLRGVWMGRNPEELRQYLSVEQDVAVDGEIVYKPNGKPLRLAATAVRPAGPRDAVFGDLPSAGDLQTWVRRPRRGHLTAGDWIGSWPGEETDEQLAELLAALR